jgi:hypothetical protein
MADSQRRIFSVHADRILIAQLADQPLTAVVVDSTRLWSELGRATRKNDR